MSTTPATARAPIPSTRLVSLDVFRGATMAAMVIVNNPGDWGNVYAPLLHAEWHGWTPTDLIFPFFLFIVGVAMTLSRATLGPWGRILRRAATIAGLGVLLAGFPYFPLATWRIPGVLVRIGIGYLAATALFRWTLPSGTRDDRRHAVRLAWVAAVLVLGYWAAMVLAPYPGHVPGDLSQEGNLAAFIDRAVIGQAHMYRQRGWDPEGLASTLPSIATILAGVITGFWLRAGVEARAKAAVLAAAGLALLALGLLWDLVFPINKNLWTSSFVAFTGGAAAFSLAVCYYLVDVLGWRWWTRPFVILGVNAITLYVLAGLSARLLGVIKVTGPEGTPVSLQRFIYTSWFAPLADPKNASLLYACAYLGVLFVILYGMYRKGIYLRA
jgi:predicted acyltransferase